MAKRSNESLLRSLGRSNNQKGIAKRHGFDTVNEYRDYLNRGISDVPVKKETKAKVTNVNNYFLAIDVSGSTFDISDNIEEGVLLFAKGLAKSDKKAMLTLVEFGGYGEYIKVHPKVRATGLKSYKHTSDMTTPLHEAVLECIKLSKKDKNATIVVFTDGKSTSNRSTRAEAKKAVKVYEGGLVFVGTGKDTAIDLGVPEGNILEFQTTKKGTQDAYVKLTDATKTHATNVVEGEGSKTKTEYFKTKTDIATMLRKSANKEIKVAFEKKIKEKENEGKIFSFMKAFANGRKTVHVSKFDFKALAKVVSHGEVRVLRGSHEGDKDEFGRYVFTDFDIEAGKHAIRLVNPDTILWVEIDGIKYNKK